MSVTFRDVTLCEVSEIGVIEKKVPNPMVIQLLDEQENLLLRFREAENSPPLTHLSIELYKESETARFGQKSYVIRDDHLPSSTTLLLQFERESDVIKFTDIVRKFKQGNKDSVFAQRTDESSAVQYFQFYGYLSQQQNMMQDFVRTSTYQKAILSNANDFKDKVVLDVGAGSGILSFFAVQAGAKKVYAVEASSMAKHAEQLVFSNKLSNKITIIAGKIEEITLPEPVDIIISEPMGYMLFNERMLETYLHAKKWFRPGSTKMFPSQGDLHIAPFTDAALYMEQMNKANFWTQDHFHGVNLMALRSAAVNEYFRQPVVDTFDVRICLSRSYKYSVDFEVANESDLHRIEIPLSFTINQAGEVHGLAFWFDVAFHGTAQSVWLSTSPTQPLTHWYQVRCLIDHPILVHRGQVLTGKVVLISNKRQSYDVDIELLDNSGEMIKNTLDLKNPFFRYTGQPPQPPPGINETSPSESYWATMDASNGPSTVVINGASDPNIHLMNGHQGNLVDVTPFNTILAPSHMQPQAQIAQTTVNSPSNSSSRSSPSFPRSSGSTGQVVIQSNISGGMGAMIVPCSIGGGITPSLFSQQPIHQAVTSNVVMSGVGGHHLQTQQQQQQPGTNQSPILHLNSTNFPVNNNLMIADYAAATHGLVNQVTFR